MDDNEQRIRDVGKLWGALERTNGDVKALTVAIVGIDGTNGLRGELREFIEQFREEHSPRIATLEDRVEEGIAYGKHLYDVERHKPGACIGKVALDKHIAELESRQQKSESAAVEMGKARMAMIGMIIVSMITALASVFVALQKVPTP